MTADLESAEKSSRNPDIKNALYFLGFVSSACLQELIGKPYDSQGAYSYNLFYNGLVLRTLIDEMIPTVNGVPVYTPPYQDRLYPALIEKALAKVCGGYANIPRKVPDIMEILSLFPRKVLRVPNQSSHDEFILQMFDALNKHNVVLFRTKDLEKISPFGL